MRIAFYAPLKPPTHSAPSGDRRMARLLMAALGLAGHEVFLASRLRSWDDGSRPGRHDRLAVLGQRLAGRLLVRLRRDPPDLWFTYHLYHKAPDWLGPAVTAALGIPYVVAEASHAAKRAGGPFAPGHAAAAAAIARADAVFCLNTADEAGLRSLVADPGRLIRLPPFLETEPYIAASAARPALRQRLAADLDLDPAVPWLLAVGMMRPGDKERSYAVLADALARLPGLAWRLLVIGDGERRDAVVARLERAVPAGRLRCPGALDAEALAGVYAACDLLVWPAVNEAYGMALLEAQAAGLPVVAGRTGGVPDIVRDGETGWLVPTGDAAAFAEAVGALLLDPDRRAALARGARAAAPSHDRRHAARRLDTVLRRVVGERP